MTTYEIVKFTDLDGVKKVVRYMDRETACEYILNKDKLVKFNNRTNRCYEWAVDKITKKEKNLFEVLQEIYYSMSFGYEVEVEKMVK